MVAARWEKSDLRLITVHQLAPELAEDLADPELTAVIFIDAAVGESPDDIDGLPERIEAVSAAGKSFPPVFGHHFPPEALLAYAKNLYGADIPAWLVTIPGTDFGFGETLSDQTAGLLPALTEKVLDLLRHLENESFA
jgi:Ni,Fe-hydrogenase maturation factor